VQQPSAFAFTLMPETFSQHKRQYMRWMRGAFIRSLWRFRYLPLNTYAYWGHLIAWVQMALSSVIFVALFILWPIQDQRYLAAWPYLLAVPVLIGYGQALRYMSVQRNDQSIWSQIATFLLSPVGTVYTFTALRLMRWWAMLTPLKTGWGTRATVEVRLADVSMRRPALDVDGPTRPLLPIADTLAGAKYWDDGPTVALPVAGRPPAPTPPARIAAALQMASGGATAAVARRPPRIRSL